MTHLETEHDPLPPPNPEADPHDRPHDRRWARSDDRVVLGVASGLGRALAIDPLIIRVAFVVLALFSGVGILLYLAAYLLLADSPTSPPPSTVRRMIGGGAAIAGGWWLFGGNASLPNAGWVIALGLLGAAVALWRGRNPAELTTRAPAPAADVAQPGGQPSSGDRWETWTARRRNRPRPPRSALGLLTLGAASVVGAVVWLLSGSSDNRGAWALGWATVVIGIGLVVGAFIGRARWLVFPAILTAVAALFASALAFAHVDLGDRSGDRTEFITADGTVSSSYSTGIGDFQLVLSEYPNDVTTRVDVAVGHLTVIVPDNAHVQVTSRVGIGTMDVLGSTRSGYRRTLVVDDNKAGAQLIKLDLRMGTGNIEVRRGLFFDGGPKIVLPRNVPPPLTIGPDTTGAQFFGDGTVLFADGSIDFGDGGRIEADGSYSIPIVEQRPDGSLQLENGAVVRADGTVVTPGGFVIARHSVAVSPIPPTPTTPPTGGQP